MLSRVRLFATPWTVACQAPPSLGFSRQGYWSGLPFPSPGDLPNPGIELGSPALQADALLSEPQKGLRIMFPPFKKEGYLLFFKSEGQRTAGIPKIWWWWWWWLLLLLIVLTGLSDQIVTFA